MSATLMHTHGRHFVHNFNTYHLLGKSEFITANKMYKHMCYYIILCKLFSIFNKKSALFNAVHYSR
jgi:hypothetical protein